MKSMKTRIISFILCLAFTLTVWPLATFAESIEDIEGVTDALLDLFSMVFYDESDSSSENDTPVEVNYNAKFANPGFVTFYQSHHSDSASKEIVVSEYDIVQVYLEYTVDGNVKCAIGEYLLSSDDEHYNADLYSAIYDGPYYNIVNSSDLVIYDPTEGPSAEEVESVYQELLSITTWQQWEEFVESLDDDMKQALMELPEEQVEEINRLDEYFYKQKQEEFAPPAVDYTEVAPLVLKVNIGDTEISVDGVMPVNAELNASALDTEFIDLSEYNISDSDNIVGAYDIKLINNGQEWQPNEGEYLTLTIYIPDIQNGESVLVHHNHNGVISTTSCIVENGLISVETNGFSDFILELNDSQIEYQYAQFKPYKAVFNKSPVKLYGSHLPDESDDYMEFEVTDTDIITVEAKYIFSDNTELYIISENGYEGENEDLRNAITPSDYGKRYNLVRGEDIKAYTEDPSDDVQEVYNLLVSLTSWVNWEDYVETLSDEMKEALLNLPEEQVAEIERLDNYFYKEKVIDFMPPAVDYTEVAPLVGNIYSPVSEVNNNASWRNENSIKSRYNSTEPFKMSYSFIGLNGNTDDPADDEIPNNGLNLKKTAAPDGNGGYTITLEAYTTGNVTPGEATPSDIILVLDLSTSMTKEFSASRYEYTEAYPQDGSSETYYLADGSGLNWCSDCSCWAVHSWLQHYSTKYYAKTSATDDDSGHVQLYTRSYVDSMTRLEALQSAMTSFIDTVADQATADRIALVGFHKSSVLIYGNSDANALVDATENSSDLIAKINNIDPVAVNYGGDLDNATEHGRGMEKAKAIFDAQTTTDYTNRNKVVIMVTDGEPAPSGTNNWSSRTVKQAINAAYDLKKPVSSGGHEATVYTISVMPGTDASNPTTDMDKYMDYMSSNYPNAQYNGDVIDNEGLNGDSYYKLNDPWGTSEASKEETEDIIQQITPGTKVTTTGSYYLTAGNLEALNTIFGNIAEQTGGASIPLDATTQIKDIIAPQFILPDGTDTSKISVTTKDATYDENGSLGWTESTLSGFDPIVNIEGNNVTVSGFDFTHNFVAAKGRLEGDVSQPGSFHGRKLIISFTVNPSDSFLGGNGVYTNGSESGVYKVNGESVEPFNIPDVDVHIKPIDPILENQYIYLTNDADLDAMIAGSAEEIDYRYEYKLGNETYDFDGVNNAYVDVTYYVTDAEGQLIKTLTIEAGETRGVWSGGSLISGLSADTTEYKIYCTVTPTTEGTYAEQQGDEKTGKVYVFKPELTFQDHTVDYDSVINGTSYDSNSSSWEYETKNHVSTVWKNGSLQKESTASDIIMSGTVPTLTFTYVPDSSDVKEETQGDTTILKVSATDYVAVDVTVKVDEASITKDCTFIHRHDENSSSCSEWKAEFSGGKPAFLLHVINAVGQLKIIKTGLNQKTHATTDSYWDQESAIFTVTENEDYDKDGKFDSFTVVIIADESGYGEVTISNLKHGRIYIISEDSGWTWRYETTYTNGNQATIKGNETVEVKVKNTHEKDKWLDGSTWAVNVFGSTSGTYYDPNYETGKDVSPN